MRRPPRTRAPAHEIELQVRRRKRRLRAGDLATAQQRAHPGQQLGEREGLAQVIVRAELQAPDAVVDLIARREEQDRRVLARRADAAQDLPAVHLRKHHVEHDEVAAFGEREVQAVGASARDVRHEAGLG